MRRKPALIALAALITISGAIATTLALQSPETPVVEAFPPSGPPVPPPIAAQAATKSTAPVTSSDLILDLFQPTDAALDQQHSDSQISHQIENAMVVSYTLVRCNLISQKEYADSFNALITYATRARLAPDAASAETRVREIANAAAASYSMVYSTTPCNDPGLPAKATALKAWREAITGAK